MVTRFRRYWQMADILFKYQFGVIVQKLFPGVHRYVAFGMYLSKKLPVNTPGCDGH